MPLKAVIFHGNIVQPPDQSARRSGWARRGSVLDLVLLMIPGGLCPALVPHSPAPRSEPRRKYRLCSLFSPPLTGTDCCRPTPGILMMRSGGAGRYTRKYKRSTRKSCFARPVWSLKGVKRHFGALPKIDKRSSQVIQNVVFMQRNSKKRAAGENARPYFPCK